MKERIVKIFISSTFREMISERDEIQQIVFSKIRFWARRLGISVLPIDLRWGITERDIEEGKLARQCEDAIRECAPYFIALLGNSYGSDSKAVLGDVERGYYGKSVTDYEITKGVIETGNVKALVYEISYTRFKEKFLKKYKLKRLKKQIARTTNLIRINIRERLVITMMSDIKALLERDFSEEFYRDDFSKDVFFTRSSYYSQYYNRFLSGEYYDEFLKNRERALFVRGKEEDTVNIFMYNLAFGGLPDGEQVFFHDFCISPYPKTCLGFIRHFIDFLTEKTRSYFYSCGDLYEDLYGLLADESILSSNCRIFVTSLSFIDRIEADKIVNLLSRQFPERFTVLLSYYGGAVFFSSVPAYHISDLNADEARRFIKSYLHEYKKDNNSELTHAIVDGLMCAKSYDISFLQLLLDEVLLRGCPSDRILEEISSMTGVENADEMYRLVLGRLIGSITLPDGEKSAIRDICVILSLVKDYALYEDIRLIMQKVGYPSHAVTEGLELLGGLLSVCENQFRLRFKGIAKIVQKCFPKKLDETEQMVFTAYFESAPATLHTTTELLACRERRGDIRGMIDVVLSLDRFFMLYRENMALLYNVAERDKVYTSKKLSALADALDKNRKREVGILLDFTINGGYYEVADAMVERLAADERLADICLIRKGYLLRERGDYRGAAACFERFLSIGSAAVEDLVKAYDYLSYCYGKLHMSKLSAEYAKKAIGLRRNDSHKFEFDLPVSLNSLAYNYFKSGRYDDAQALYDESLDIRIKYLGAKHPRVANNLNNIGEVCFRRGKFSEALVKFESCMDILRGTVGEEHIYTQICLVNLALCRCVITDDCPEVLLASVTDAKKKLSELMKNCDYTAYADMAAGVILLKMRRKKEAMRHLDAAMRYYRQTFDEDAYEISLINRILAAPDKKTEEYFE